MENNYLRDTKKKLAKFDRMKDLVELRKKDIETFESQLQYVDELSSERINRNIKKFELEIMVLENDIEAMRRGFQQLTPLAYKIIEMKYMKKETWIAVALDTGYSQPQCARVGKEALMIVGECIYGVSIHQDLPLVAGMLCY